VVGSDYCEGPIPETSGPADVSGRYRQLKRLPLQILISVALDSCGRNSPAASAGRLKKARGVLLCFRVQLKHSRAPGAEDDRVKICQTICLANSTENPTHMGSYVT